MIKKRWMIYLSVTIFIFMVGCQQDPAQQDPAQENNSSPNQDIQYTVVGELPSSPPAQGWIQEAVVDLANKLTIDTTEVTYLAFEVPVWPDTSYGCAQPNQAYDPEPKEGYQIQLQVNGRNYFYHGGEDIEQFLCENE
jgi:hypothetical protein